MKKLTKAATELLRVYLSEDRDPEIKQRVKDAAECFVSFCHHPNEEELEREKFEFLSETILDVLCIVDMETDTE